jgi:hypothetical protein
MKTLLNLSALVLILGVMPTFAAEDDGFLKERIKVALNDMVKDVRAAETPNAKRDRIEGFLDRLDRGSNLAKHLPMGEEQRIALENVQKRFAGYAAEYRGTADRAGVPDGELDAFASFMQQDIEQAAEVAWGSGGVYLSVGAIIIILLILILIT